MGIKKTLGGDRLGSGNKMQVDLHGYERSTHDKGYVMRTTMAAGTLVPCINEIVLPGDTFDINLNMSAMTHPTVGPLFSGFKAQIDVFQAPLRLYMALLHNNATGVGRKMSNVKFPQLRLTARPTPEGTEDLDNSQINPSSLLAYLGIRGVGITEEETTRDFNAIPTLAYWEIYKNYYSNKQEEIGAYLHTPQPAIIETVDNVQVAGSTLPQAPTTTLMDYLEPGELIVINWTGATPNFDDIYITTAEYGRLNLSSLGDGWRNLTATAVESTYTRGGYGILTVLNWDYRNSADMNPNMPNVHTFALSNIDDMRMEILKAATTTPLILNNTLLKPYVDVVGSSQGINNALSNQEGLALKTYQSDLFNNWLSEEWIDGPDGVNTISAISTASGSITIDQINLSQKVYDMLNRIAVSGGSYNDWLDAVYGETRRWIPESPVYHGGLIKEVVFQEVVSNAASTEGNQPLRTIGGKGVMGKKHKGGTVVIKVEEPSIILGIVSLTPRIDYSQGNDWQIHLKTMDDLHKPALDEIGFQDLTTEQMAWWDTNYNGTGDVWVQKSAGKQPAWINYMTSVNKTYGNFAISSNEMFMTLNRRYEPEAIAGGYQIADLTTYIDPAKYNHIFAQTSRDAQNFWVQVAVDITARRKMSGKLMPNL